MLNNINDNSSLLLDNSSLTIGQGFAPTENYPSGSAQVRVKNASTASVYLLFASGYSGNFTVPQQTGSLYNLVFGGTGGFPYSINITNSKANIIPESYPNSTLNIIGDGNSADIPINISYYIVNNTGNSTLSNLPVNGTFGGSWPNGTPVCVSDGGTAARTLCFYQAVLPIFAWSIYPSSPSNGFSTTISGGKFNEVGVFCNTNGGAAMIVNLVGVVGQYAQLDAVSGNGCGGATINVSGSSKLWNQGIIAQGGTTLNLDNTTTIHGNILTADSTSHINFTGGAGAVDGRNDSGSCTLSGGYPPVDGSGNPTCNPQNPLGACSQYLGSGTYSGTPVSCP
jgi:hypothetical protein